MQSDYYRCSECRCKWLDKVEPTSIEEILQDLKEPQDFYIDYFNKNPNGRAPFGTFPWSVKFAQI